MLPFPRARTLSIVLATALGATACGKDGSKPTTPVTPPPPAKATVEVFVSSGVLGSPSPGKVVVDSGASVSYNFSLAPGYQDLSVYMDTVLVSAAGTVSTATGSHVLRASAMPVPVSGGSAEATPLTEIYGAGGDPSEGFGTLIDLLRDAYAKHDTATLVRIRAAEYAQLMQGGPEALAHARAALAGQTYVAFGESSEEGSAGNRVLGTRAPLTAARRSNHAGAASRRALNAELSPDLFAADTVVPTTVIFVNGILNGSSSTAAASATQVLQALSTAGFNTSGAVEQDANAARPASSIRVLFHFNPIAETQFAPWKCITALDWASETARLADAGQDEDSWSARALSLLQKVSGATKFAGCVFPVSSNARVLEDYVRSELGGLSGLSQNDVDLTNLIASERALAGGRNVIVLGHSHGTLIARSVVANSAAPASNTGCLGTVAVAAPIGDNVAWPNSQSQARIIALGRAGLVSDVLYPLGLPRTDGSASELTDEIETKMSSLGWTLTHPFISIWLHSFDHYMDPRGHRAAIVQALSREYSELGRTCGGELFGTVYDLETLRPIAGATVQSLVAGKQRGSTVLTKTDGSFQTDTLRPVLHDVVITAPGYDTVQLAQRLVPFHTAAAVQSGPVYLARPCPAGTKCSMNGQYSVHYVLTGTEGGYPTSCTFDAEMTLVDDTDSTYHGTVTTRVYQSGCRMPDGAYVYWGAGTNALTGTRHGSSITMVHPAIPTWHLTGRSFAAGFQATEPAWYSGPFNLRVEIAATRTGNASPDRLRASVLNGSPGPMVHAGP